MQCLLEPLLLVVLVGHQAFGLEVGGSGGSGSGGDCGGRGYVAGSRLVGSGRLTVYLRAG